MLNLLRPLHCPGRALPAHRRAPPPRVQRASVPLAVAIGGGRSGSDTRSHVARTTWGGVHNAPRQPLRDAYRIGGESMGQPPLPGRGTAPDSADRTHRVPPVVCERPSPDYRAARRRPSSRRHNVAVTAVYFLPQGHGHGAGGQRGRCRPYAVVATAVRGHATAGHLSAAGAGVAPPEIGRPALRSSAARIGHCGVAAGQLYAASGGRVASCHPRGSRGGCGRCCTGRRATTPVASGAAHAPCRPVTGATATFRQCGFGGGARWHRPVRRYRSRRQCPSALFQAARATLQRALLLLDDRSRTPRLRRPRPEDAADEDDDAEAVSWRARYQQWNAREKQMRREAQRALTLLHTMAGGQPAEMVAANAIPPGASTVDTSYHWIDYVE
eukprot:ctg_410.g213